MSYKSVFLIKNILYVVMTKLYAETLESYLSSHKDLSEGEIRLLISQIRDGLLYCQKTRNISHCKLTPSNILIDNDQNITVKYKFIVIID